MSDKPSFFAELKRRHVVRVGLAYVVVSWLLLQLAAILFPAFGAPHWAIRLLFAFLVIGLPVAILLAWAFEVTPEGVRRTEPEEAEAARSAGHRRHVGRALNVGIILVLAAAVGVLLWQRLGTSPKTQAAPAAVAATAGAAAPTTGTAIPAKSIAVLPFENLSTDKANAYFADGMQDLILTKLADIGELQVVSRTSTMKYASHPDDLKSIARQLGVATVLEGSVQKSGNQVLINVQLIDARTDRHLWAQSYQRTLDNIFGVEGEVAQKIASALQAHLTPRETSQLAKAGTHNKQALDASLRGTFYFGEFLRTRDVNDWTRSLALLKKAVQLDPDYVDAWNSLALAYAFFPEYHRQQRQAARRALQLAPDNAEAHRQMAFVLSTRGKPAQALAEAERAVELAPNSRDTVSALAYVQMIAGKLDASIATYHKVLSMPGRRSGVLYWAMLPLILERRYTQARGLMRNYLVTHPNDLSVAYQMVYTELAGWGDIDAARAVLQAAATKPEESAIIAQAWFRVDWFARDYVQAGQIMQRAPSALFRGRDKPRALYLGWAYRKQGETAKAQAAFARARDEIRHRLKTVPDYAGAHAALALALSGLGEHAQAIHEAQRAMSLTTVAMNAERGPEYIAIAARVEAAAGDNDAAIRKLRQLLDMPAGYAVSVPLLKLDPTWDPLRKDPRFQALLKQYPATPATATTP